MMNSGSPSEWMHKFYEPSLKQGAERKTSFDTSSQIHIHPVYAPESTQEGLPGVYPYTRGIHPSMYRSKFWTMRQYAGFGDARESNERYRYLLSQGQTGLSVAFDLPTQMGYDSDSPMAAGEVGKVGVAIDSLADMNMLTSGIALDKVSTSMTINATASTLLCMYIASAQQQGIASTALQGTIQNDILKEYMARGTYIYPPRPSMRLITDTFAFCKENVPKWNTISISGYHVREAGCTAAQEIGLTLADGIAYVEAALQAGMLIDDFAPRLAFFFNVHNHFFEEIAKFRAARQLWANIMKERFHAKNPKSLMLRFHTQTAGSTLTAQQPENNIVRVGLQALAAVLGGTQSLHTNAMDEALALPSEKSARIALRTQQIIAHETGVADVADPLGGSYFVEQLTQDLYDKAQNIIEHIDNLGGMIAAIEQGYPQREIQEAAYQAYLALEKKESIVVGVNEFVSQENTPTELLKISAQVEQEQKKRLAEVKASRSASQVQQSLTALKQAAQQSTNVLPYILTCVQNYCTVGEIADTFRDVFGLHQEIHV